MQIAIALNRRDYPTPGDGSLWRKSTVAQLLNRQYVKDIERDMPY